MWRWRRSRSATACSCRACRARSTIFTSADDPRRGWAYNVYYVGVNIGGFLAPLICGTLGELYGWHYGFGAAGVGMVAGLVIYLVGAAYLPPRDAAQRMLPARATSSARQRPRHRSCCCSAIGLAVTVFRGAYEQVGNTVALWTDDGVDRAIGGFVIPMTWFQSLNPLFVIADDAAAARLLEAPAPAWARAFAVQKMATGALIVGAAYLLLAAAAGDQRRRPRSWLWLLSLSSSIFTLGELFILPTGLGLFARLAPPKLGATTVASWFLAIFAAA